MKYKSLCCLFLALALSVNPGLLLAKMPLQQTLSAKAVSVVGKGPTPVFITRRGNPSVNSVPSTIGIQLNHQSTNLNGTEQEANTADFTDFLGLTAQSRYVSASSQQQNKHNNHSVVPSNADESSKVSFSNGTIVY